MSGLDQYQQELEFSATHLYIISNSVTRQDLCLHVMIIRVNGSDTWLTVALYN